jgi:hypothetical protein
VRPRIALQLAHGRLLDATPSGRYCPDHGDQLRDFGESFDLLRPRFISHNSNVGEPDFYDGHTSMLVAGSHSKATIREEDFTGLGSVLTCTHAVGSGVINKNGAS